MKTNKTTPLVDEMLESLQEMKEVDAGPYFYTRLRARMERQETGNAIGNLRPAWIVAALLFMLAINSFILSKQFSTKENKVADSSIESVAVYYNQNISSY